MTGALRIGWGFTRVALHIATGALIIALIFPLTSESRRTAVIRWWSRKLLRIGGIALQVQGRMLEPSLDTPGAMLLMNHVSWLDIFAVHSVRPVRFVAKSEVRRWPVIGFLCAHTGTLFIERGRRHAVHQANHAIADALRAGDTVAVFPEGTTTDGSHLLPFHANLVQAALAAQVAVQPVALRYRDAAGRPTTAPAFVGEDSLLDSLRLSLRGAPITAELHFLPPIDVTGRTRHEVGALARAAIAADLGFELSSPAGGTADMEPEISLGPQDELL